MKSKKKWIWIVLSVLVLLFMVITASLLFSLLNKPHETIHPGSSESSTDSTYAEYIPGQLPEGVNFAVAEDGGQELSEEELYDGYSHEEDPAHPVLDVQTSLQISNLGTQPGVPRPQDIAVEYPHILVPPTSQPSPTQAPAPTPDPSYTPTPSVTLTPGIIPPKLNPDIDIPPIELPELYIVNPDVPSPSFTGDSFHLSWKYSGGRHLTYDISFSTDGGTSFLPLLEDIGETECDLTFPDAISGQCVLRVSGIINESVYLTADSSLFSLVAAPEVIPPPISNYVDPQVQYVNLPGMRINRLPALLVWFKAENYAKDTDKLIWQLSRTPFLGTKERFAQDGEVLVSGEIGKAGGEFSLDLDALCEEMAKPDIERDASISFYAEHNVYEFYLRIVPLDASGNCIGDPGRGLYFTYGMPEIVVDSASDAMVEDPQIQLQVNVPYYTKTQWKRISPDILDQSPDNEAEYIMFAGMDGPHEEDPDSSVVDWIEDATEELAEDAAKDAVDGVGENAPPKGVGSKIISQAVQVEIQIATSPFTSADSIWQNSPNGLVYSYLDTSPEIFLSETLGSTYCSSTDHGLEYDQFLPSIEDIETMGGIYYYVRAVFYVPDSENPSLLHSYPSEALTIAYRATSASKNEVETITVKSYMPFVQFLRYYPIQWPQDKSEEYFEVTRHIEAEEMTFAFTYKGEYLLPYYDHISEYDWTREQYQAKLDEMLPPGRILHIKPAETSFWDEFIDLLSAIYQGVSEAYANAKSSVVDLVDYIPLIGDEAMGYLKKAAAFAIDYGLASIGLPPSLPNLDQLAEGSIDYITKVAIEQALQAAGVPADSSAAAEITEKVQQELADGIASELEKAILAQQQNPFNVSFLRLDSHKLYQPAFIDVSVTNFSETYTTRSGSLGFSSGNSFDVYKSTSVDIPALTPGETIVIRIYLDHYRNKYDGYNKYFDATYNGNSGRPYELRVGAYFPMPDVNIAAAEQGLSRAPLPVVTEFVYDHTPYSYSRDFVPADIIYDKDPAPDPFDYMDDTNFGEE